MKKKHNSSKQPSKSKSADGKRLTLADIDALEGVVGGFNGKFDLPPVQKK